MKAEELPRSYVETINNLIDEYISYRDDGTAYWTGNNEDVESEEQIFREAKEALVVHIHQWDKRDIKELVDALIDLRDINELLDGELSIDPYDWDDLPSADIPIYVDTSYPIYSMDKSGRCLTSNMEVAQLYIDGHGGYEISTHQVVGMCPYVTPRKGSFRTPIEWLRARWMQEHHYEEYSDWVFDRFDAPDLSAEEIRECKFVDLYTLEEFVKER